MTNYLPPYASPTQAKTAHLSDIVELSFTQDLCAAAIRKEVQVLGLPVRIAELAGILGALVRRGFDKYMVDQRQVAAQMARLCHLPVFGRQYISKLELIMERLGYLEIPKYSTYMTSKTKVRSFTRKFIDLVYGRVSFNCATEKRTPNSGINKPPAKAVPDHGFISNPLRRAANPFRATIYDTNHLKALAKRGVHMSGLSAVDRQFLFHCQKAVVDDMQALKLFADMLKARETGEARACAFFAGWPLLRKGRRTAAVQGLLGQDRLREIRRRRLCEQDRQFLFYVSATTPDIREAVRLFVEVVRLREAGYDYIYKFFNNWSDLTKHSKAGQVRLLKQSLSAPSEDVDGYIHDKGEMTALPDVPDDMSASECIELLNALVLEGEYDGRFEALLEELRGLSVSALDTWMEKLHKKTPP